MRYVITDNKITLPYDSSISNSILSIYVDNAYVSTIPSISGVGYVVTLKSDNVQLSTILYVPRTNEISVLTVAKVTYSGIPLGSNGADMSWLNCSGLSENDNVLVVDTANSVKNLYVVNQDKQLQLIGPFTHVKGTDWTHVSGTCCCVLRQLSGNTIIGLGTDSSNLKGPRTKVIEKLLSEGKIANNDILFRTADCHPILSYRNMQYCNVNEGTYKFEDGKLSTLNLALSVDGAPIATVLSSVNDISGVWSVNPNRVDGSGKLIPTWLSVTGFDITYTDLPIIPLSSSTDTKCATTVCSNPFNDMIRLNDIVFEGNIDGSDIIYQIGDYHHQDNWIWQLYMNLNLSKWYYTVTYRDGRVAKNFKQFDIMIGPGDIITYNRYANGNLTMKIPNIQFRT